MWSNYHSHSKYCDGKGEISDYIAAAKKNNVKSIGISSHAPVPFPCKWCMDKSKLSEYLSTIDDLRKINPDLEIYKGLEVDFVPGITSPNNFKDELDYSVGSIHFVDQFPDGTRWEIDNTHVVFLDGLEKIFKNNIKDAIVRYFELSCEMLYGSTPDILGHLDKIKIQNVDGKFFNESDTWYQHEVKKLINLAEQANIIVEVNTRGIYQKKTTSTYPGLWILELIRSKNIRITISSDAHHPDDLINQFPETAKLLYNAGFRELAVLREGAWKQLPFDEKGLKE
jgi:histidinol-phosphatase (PHP family)